ncbi:hypothetical protein LINPERHAP1_LOCUS17539 [Linum perenne]
MRVRVRIDITSPLKKERKVRWPRGEWLLGKYRYEKLPTFCYVCERIGHVERHCEIFYRTPETDLVRNWDATLRAEYKPPVILGGEQYMVPKKVAGDSREPQGTRRVLGQLNENTYNLGREHPNVRALMNNFGARVSNESMGGWMEGTEDMDGIEGVELPEDKKRRRNGEAGGSWRGSVEVAALNQGVNVPKNVKKAGPGSGTCPPQ